MSLQVIHPLSTPYLLAKLKGKEITREEALKIAPPIKHSSNDIKAARSVLDRLIQAANPECIVTKVIPKVEL